jgi:hypothetical protein
MVYLRPSPGLAASCRVASAAAAAGPDAAEQPSKEEHCQHVQEWSTELDSSENLVTLRPYSMQLAMNVHGCKEFASSWRAPAFRIGFCKKSIETVITCTYPGAIHLRHLSQARVEHIQGRRSAIHGYLQVGCLSAASTHTTLFQIVDLISQLRLLDAVVQHKL